MADRQIDSIIEWFQRNFNLDETSATHVFKRAEAYAAQLGKPGRELNDFALAKYLNDQAIYLFEMVAHHQNIPDVTDINRSYILIVNELKKLYNRNAELEKIDNNICWKIFDSLEHVQEDIEEYNSYNNYDSGQRHNSKVNRLCISYGKEKPDFTPEIKKLISQAEKNGKKFYEGIKPDEQPVEERNWYIPEYSFSYSKDGSLLINDIKGILKVKRIQAGSAPDRLIEQALKNQNELFKPDLGRSARTVSTILSDLGFSGTLKVSP